MTYPWGHKYRAKRMNTWEGEFPKENKLYDGYHGTAPVKTYVPQNKYGLYNMLGNVWEWVSDNDNGDNDEDEESVKKDKSKKKLKSNKATPKQKVLRGGSFVDS